MDKTLENTKSALILLHEIYGVNAFIQTQCQKYKDMGFDVFCPNLTKKPPFPYENAQDAYDFFIKNIGFDVSNEISRLVSQLKKTYAKVFILGFSVGATIAWRCCENTLCSGIIACYGSRIRDYTQLNPVVPTLLLFAKEDAFDVDALTLRLQDKHNLSITVLDAKHGFIDSCSPAFDSEQSKSAEDAIAKFLNI